MFARAAACIFALIYLAGAAHGWRNPGLGFSNKNLQKNGIHIGQFKRMPYHVDASTPEGTC